MAAPKIPMPTPPTFDALGTGAKLTPENLMPILLGAIPLAGEVHAGGVDVINFAACPTGRLRVVVRGFAWDGTAGSLLAWRVIKADGTEVWLDIQVESEEVAIPLHGGTISLRPVTLEEGDFLQCNDEMAAGGNIWGGIGFVDVEVR